jgi:hypothetical protein
MASLVEELRRRGLQRNMAYAKPSSTDYTTQLTPGEEIQFRDWVGQNAVRFDPDNPVQDYDMRGFWKGLVTGDPNARSGVNPNDHMLHFNDHWKTPLHHSFSNESIYATPMAPSWNEQDQLRMPMNGAVVFDERKFNKQRR